MSVSRVATLCKSSWYIVERTRKAFEEGGFEKAAELKWGAGAKFKFKLSAEEIEWLVHPATLRSQAHMSLPQRAATVNVRFNKEILLQDVRTLFHDVGITKQKFKKSLGPTIPTELSL